MSDLYQVEISVTLPAGGEQFDGILSHLGEMENRKDALLIKVNNYKELDDFMAVYLERRDYGYHVELDFPMDDFGWEYPLVLASGLGAKRTRQLLRDLLVNMTGTGGNEVVSTGFRHVPAVRYGEKQAVVFEKDQKAAFEKENGKKEKESVSENMDSSEEMRVTREMVLGAERCTGMQVSYSNEEVTTIHVVPEDYEEPVRCFECDGRFWHPKSQDSYWSYWDSEMMLCQMKFYTNEEALELLEEMDAFKCPCYGFDTKK